MFLNLYLDADSCSSRLVDALLRLGFQVVLGTQVAGPAASDVEQIHAAIRQDLPILSGNYKDYYPLHGQLASAGIEHPGIILWTRERFSPEALAQRLYEVHSVRTKEQFRNALLWL